jgi:hypothetical protein
MEITLARGSALFRSPVLTQSSFAQEAVQDRAAGDVQGLTDGDRATAAQDKPLDIQEMRGLVEHRGGRHHEGQRRPGQVEAPAPGPGERPHEGHTHSPGDPHGPTPGQGERSHAGPPPGQRHRMGEPGPGEEMPPDEALPGKDAQATDMSGSEELSEEDRRIVESLQRRDRAVRSHEAAHMAAAGAYAAGGPSYTTEQGPDGRSYAIGGEVPIDMSAERTPEATLRKAQTIAAAAMAPADPSGADKAIAAAASQMAENAQAAISERATAELEERTAQIEETREQSAEAKAAESGDEGDEAGPSAASSEGFAALREGLSEVAPTRPKQVPGNRRGQLSKAYVAMAQAPARATLRCASCAGFH